MRNLLLVLLVGVLTAGIAISQEVPLDPEHKEAVIPDAVNPNAPKVDTEVPPTAQYYLGVKTVAAWPQEKDGQPGYAMKHRNGYTTWSPKEPFEKYYFALGPTTGKDVGVVTDDTVDRFIVKMESVQVSPRTNVATATTVTGHASSVMTNAAETYAYEDKTASAVSQARVRAKIWEFLGFVSQWADNGLKGPELPPAPEPKPRESDEARLQISQEDLVAKLQSQLGRGETLAGYWYKDSYTSLFHPSPSATLLRKVRIHGCQ